MFKSININAVTQAAVYGVNAIIGLVLNSALIFGIYKTRRNNRFSRNEILVLILSFIDLIIAVVYAISPTVIIKSLNELGCKQLAVIRFWNIFLIDFTGSIILLISTERLITVIYDSKFCGFDFRGIHLIPILIILTLINTGLGVWYAFVGVSEDFLQHSFFYFSDGAYRVIHITAIAYINVLLFMGMKNKLSNTNGKRNLKGEMQYTKAIVLVSIILLIMYLFLIISEFYLGTIITTGAVITTTGETLLTWTPFLCQLNSIINALIFIFKNRRVSLMYKVILRKSINRRRNDINNK